MQRIFYNIEEIIDASHSIEVTVWTFSFILQFQRISLSSCHFIAGLKFVNDKKDLYVKATSVLVSGLALFGCAFRVLTVSCFTQTLQIWGWGWTLMTGLCSQHQKVDTPREIEPRAWLNAIIQPHPRFATAILKWESIDPTQDYLFGSFPSRNSISDFKKFDDRCNSPSPATGRVTLW